MPFYAIFTANREALDVALDFIDMRVEVGEETDWPVNAGRFENGFSQRVAAIDVAMALPRGLTRVAPGELRECVPVAWTATGSGVTELTVWEHPEGDRGFLVFVGTATAFEEAVLAVSDPDRPEHSEPSKTLAAALIKGADPVVVWSDRLPAYRGDADAASAAYIMAAEGRLALAHRIRWAVDEIETSNPDALVLSPHPKRRLTRQRRLAMAIIDERKDRFVKDRSDYREMPDFRELVRRYEAGEMWWL